MSGTGNNRSPTGPELISLAVDYFLQDTHTMLPGKIESYDESTQKAQVKPLIKRLVLLEDGSEIQEELPIIPDVPVIFQRAGEFAITLPINSGDFVMLVFAERSIDKYLAGDGNDTNPDEFRMHDLTDAVAIPGFAPFNKSLKRTSKDSVIAGHQSGAGVVYFKKDNINLGSESPGDNISLDSKVQTELKAIRDSLNNLITVFNAHIHSGVTTGPGSSGPTPTPGTAPSPVGTTKSEIVKING